MRYGEAHRLLKRRLSDAGAEAADSQAVWILESLTGFTRADLVAHADRELSERDWQKCLQLLQRLLKGEPLQYVLGTADFCGLRLDVSPAVLIPRPETEQLVEAVLGRIGHFRSPRLLDVGTGSGCIALAAKHQRRDARVFAFDVDPAALAIASKNARATGLQVSLYAADAQRRGFARAFAGLLDAIVSNPPYIDADERQQLPENVRDFEPVRALIAAPDPLMYYRSISREAAAVLRPGGLLAFEVHEERSTDVATLMEKDGFLAVETLRDLAARPRIVLGWRRGGIRRIS